MSPWKKRDPRTAKKGVDPFSFSEAEQKEYYKSRLLNYLSRQHTEKEAVDYLKKISCPEALLDEIIQFAMDYHFLDDENYGACFIRDSVHLRHHSCRQIRYELRMKGLDADLIEKVMTEEAPEDLESLEILTAQRYRQKEQEAEPERTEKCIRWLMQRGFSYDDIVKTIDKIHQKL